MTNRMLPVVLGALALSTNLAASEIDFVEKYALATDREAVLKELIPGTDEFYYYHGLFHQAHERYEQVDQLLKQWRKVHGETDRYRQIELRQTLLTYPAKSQQTLAFLQKHLQLRFDHTPRRIDLAPNHPTRLPPELLDFQRLVTAARQSRNDLGGITNYGLWRLDVGQLSGIERRDLLSRLTHPGLARLAEIVVEDLQFQGSRGFGSLPIHRLLTLEQLDQCRVRIPALASDRAFVNTYLVRLQPDRDTEWDLNPEVMTAYLDRLEAFVSSLPDALNSLKAHVLYHRLVLDRSLGKFDSARFVRYLQLPRNARFVRREWREQQGGQSLVDLNFDGASTTLLGPIGSDQQLIEDYLRHFFVEASDISEYATYLDNEYLRWVFAETKLIEGLGDAENWYSLLPPQRLQAIRDRVDLEFLPTNRLVFAARDPVALTLRVKNVPKLIVKVFEINGNNFFRDNRRPLNTDVNLDGLVANSETTYTYTEPPIRQIDRRFEFPELSKPGMYVVDFIGNGISSRAVIRKGQHRFLEQMGPSGHRFTILSADNQKLPGAAIWMGGREYRADDDGSITLPFSTAPGVQPFIIEHDGWASLHEFQHQAESYELRAGFHVERESLRRHSTATVLVRAGLYVNDVPISLSIVNQPRMVITSTDLDGIESTKTVDDIQIFEDRESLHEFRVPARLTRLKFELTGTVRSQSENKDIPLASSTVFALNEIDRSPYVADLHLVKSDGDYLLEVRGKAGEVRADHVVMMQLQHRAFTEPVHFQLKSDKNGIVELGPLADVERLTATSPMTPPRNWQLRGDRRTEYQSRNGIVGSPVRIPIMGGEAAAARVQLFALRDNVPVSNESKRISYQDGMLVLDGLAAGDYALYWMDEGRRSIVRITDGKVAEGYALGKHRSLEQRGARPLQITNVEIDADKMTIRLANSTKWTRLHVFATRYLPAHDVMDAMASVTDVEPVVTRWPTLRSMFMAGRDIGDEYRYILERKGAHKYPGNMLDRPTPLLNPWAIQTAHAERQIAAEGEVLSASPDASSLGQGRSQSARRRAQEEPSQSSNLDFLADGAVVMANLRANENGIIEIPRSELGAHQHLHIVAIDPVTTVYREFSTPVEQALLVDLRLSDGLNTESHFTQQKQVTTLRKGEKFVIDDVVSSSFQTYDSLPSIFRLLQTLGDAKQLAKFAFLTRWDELSVDEQRAKYSEFACHELHFFLYHRDPEFFQQVVRPYLQNKLHKTFLDRWLLGEELRDFLSPWSYEQLNVVERILLGQQIESDRRAMQRHIRESLQLLPPDATREERLFESVMAGRSLDLGLLADKLRLEEGDRKRMPRSAGFGGVEVREGAVVRSARKEVQLFRGGETASEADDQAESSHFFAPPGRDASGDGLYRELESTREWAENNYYEIPIEQQGTELITVNRFWSDFANHRSGAAFLSHHFPEASRNLAEALLALSLVDLPMTAGDHQETFDEATMTLVAASPILVFHEQIRPADVSPEPSPLLVSQNMFAKDDRYQFVDNVRRDKFITDEFVTHRVYGCQVVVTNPTSTPRRVELLLQIPTGALPLMGSKATNSVAVDLPAFQTISHEYHFYFPAVCETGHFPVHVSEQGTLVAFAEPMRFRVVAEPTRVDRDSWAYVSQQGSNEEVIEFLTQSNLQRIELAEIAFRMQDKPTFEAVTRLLADQHAYHDTLWSYGIRHNSAKRIGEFLQHQDPIVAQLGGYLNSELLSINPIEHCMYQHLDYKPLVNARAHRLGKRETILNEKFYAQYHRLMNLLSLRRQLDQHDLVSVTYYLLLQDRIGEAMQFFAQIDREAVASQLQYDYFAAYLDCYRTEPTLARSIAANYANYPVDRWRIRFGGIQSMLDQRDGKLPTDLDRDNRTDRQIDLASRQPGLDLKVDGQTIRLNYQNLETVTLNFYEMDLEVLFSRNPFVQQFSGQFSSIRPNESVSVSLPAGASTHSVELPATMQNKNVLVEVVGGGIARSKEVYSNSLVAQLTENYGQVRVTHQPSGRPLSTVYVKVYARMQSGDVRFYKDGYTDLRGLFDYTSLSTNDLAQVEKFSILLLSDEFGAIVREAAPPKR